MLDKLAKVGVVVIAAGLIVGVVGYFVTRESPRKMGAAFEQTVRRASHDFAESIPVERDLENVLFLIVQRGNRDEENQARQIIEDDVRNIGKYKVKTWGDVLAKLKGLGRLMEQAGLISDEPPDSVEDARKVIKLLQASNVRIDGVLLARVVDFNSGDHGLGSKVTIEGELHDLKTNKKTELPKRTEEISSSLDYTYLSNRIQETSFVARFLLWFVVAAAVPFALKSVIAAVTAKRQNELNAVLLGALTLIDVALGWILIVSLGYGWGSVVVLGVLAGAMGYYNHDAVDYIDRYLR